MRKAFAISILTVMLAAALAPAAAAGVTSDRDGFFSNLVDEKTKKRLKKSTRTTVKTWSKTARKSGKRANKAFRQKVKELRKRW